MRNCTICVYLGLEPRVASGTIGLNTAIAPLIDSAVERLDDASSSTAHVLLPVCPEHVVDIYRDRVDGVTMAWRLAVRGA